VFKKLLISLMLISSSFAGVSEDLEKLGDEYINYRSRFFPVWATSVGIFDYDSLLTDYSSESVFAYRNNISKILQKLRQIDLESLTIDDYIDCRLLISNIQYDGFILGRFPYYEHSAALYVGETLNSLYYILIDNSRTMEEKGPFLLARLRQIPDFLDQRWEYVSQMDKIFFETAIEMAKDGPQLIEEAAQLLYKAMPDSTRRIARCTREAVSTLNNCKILFEIDKDDANENHFVGKQQLNYLLRNIYFLDVNSDSLKKIGWHWYNKTNSAMDSLQQIIDAKETDTGNSKLDTDLLTKDDIFQYYQWEIEQTADFLAENDIVTIPENIGECIPVEMPGFMQAMHRGIAYQPPAPFSSDQTGYFYVRPIPPLDSISTAKYNSMIKNRGFRGSVVHEAYPGHHLQLSIANRQPNPIRQIQQNIMMVEGWALYCEQMATEQGLFDDDLDRRWMGVLGGIRFRAVRIIVDCSLADGSMMPDSALVFMNNMLGENTDYFTAEIRRYCSYPTTALSYLTGKLLILEMLEKARAEEGKSFSLIKFHDKLLAEGSIPLPLISKKLGY